MSKMTNAYIRGVEERLGRMRLRSLRVGGEELLDRVEMALGAATRHLALIRSDRLTLVPGVEREIEASIRRASDLVLAEIEKPPIKRKKETPQE